MSNATEIIRMAKDTYEELRSRDKSTTPNEKLLFAAAHELEQLETQLDKAAKYIADRNLMSVSEFCSKYNYQDCSACEKTFCGDNTNPVIEANKRLRDEIRAKRQWQTCPSCSRTFATQS